ncbi:hypothetical protein [Novosphingobium terrae]|uniref:hypothetical protein n=1 Tax=Novosphingobium terrae TaxID=2726189 RepID=UPI00198216D9|nr:hypothetical protein [Novosphingobium terrae]
MEWVPIVFLTFKAFVLFTGMYFAIKWHYDQDRKKKSEAGGPEKPAEIRLFLTMIASVTLSLIGIVYAGCWGDASEGGYGGALGCAFTFFMVFMSKPAVDPLLGDSHGLDSDVLAEKEPTTLSEGLDQLSRLKGQTELLRTAFFAKLASAERDKIYLGVAGIISTLAWKFGDVAAAALNGRS